MRRTVGLRAAVCLVAAIGLIPMPLPAEAKAALMSTDQVIAGMETGADRQRVIDFLGRDDVRHEMVRLGVSPEEAAQRVGALSDDEVRRIVGHLDTMPAGGDALGLIVGTALLIFIILLITDIAGLTKVFPWTRSVR